MKKAFTFLALLLLPSLAFAQTTPAYRVGKAIQIVPSLCTSSRAATNGMLCIDSTASNVLKYTNPAGSTIALGSGGASLGNFTLTLNALDLSGAATMTIGGATNTGLTLGVAGAAHTIVMSTNGLANARMTVGDTGVTMTVPFVLSGTQTGTYTLGGTPTATSPIVGNIGSTTISSPWTAVSGGVGFTNSYVDYGAPFSTTGYYADAIGVCHLRVAVKSGTAAAAIFTLPAGKRPASTIQFPAQVDGVYGTLIITSTGVVSTNGGGTAHAINSIITYPCEN